MADPMFEPIFNSPLYVLTTTSADRGWSGFLLTPGQQAPDRPIGIRESFQNFSGHYLFADEAPPLGTAEQTQAFINTILSFVSTQYGVNATICLWIADPKTVSFGPYPAGSYSFSYGFDLSGASLRTTLNHFVGQQITLAISTSTGFDIPTDSIVLKGFSSGATLLRFITNPNDGLGPSISPQSATIPFTGAYRGCILLGGTINAPATLPFFQSGLRYTHGGDSGDVAQNYPIVRANESKSIAYAGSIDINDTFNEGPAADPVLGQLRTLLAIDPAKNAAVPSWFSASSGHTLSLVPQGSIAANGAPADGTAAFVFQRVNRVAPNQAPPTSPLVYWSVAGQFGITVDAANAPATDELLCGLYGTETIAFRPYTASGPFEMLSFTAGQQAYAPVFPYKNVTLNDISAGAPSFPLDDTCRTSWISMRSSDGVGASYRAQPQGSPLFAAPATANDAAVTVLDFHPTPATLPPSSTFSMPLAPYAGLAQASVQLPSGEQAGFESQIIGVARKALISEHTVPSLRASKQRRALRAQADAGRFTMTPQGLLAKLSSDNDPHYLEVLLAQTPPTAASTGVMAFYDLDPELQNALQTNQLFLVAVDRTNLGPPPEKAAQDAPAFADTVSIEGWTMRAAVGEGVSATDYRNVFIMKFTQGTLIDRVSNPQQWTTSTDFSLASKTLPPDLALTGLSTWLQSYINQALAMADAGNTFYQNFAAIARDPNWRGILVLRSSLDVDSLPDQLKGLAAGIDQTQFVAHHFGIYASRVTVDGTTLKIEGNSSLFGLVDYQLPGFTVNAANGRPDFPVVVPVNGAYGYTVLQLQSLFNNSKIVDFRSRVQLTLNRLFDSPVSGNFSSAGTLPINAIVLKGTYEHQDTADVYVYQTDALTLFNLNNNVLQAVAIRRAQFNAQAAPSDDNDVLESRFLLWGTFDFAMLTANDKSALDLFSFGSPPGTAPNQQGVGLNFSGLAIELRSPVATPNTITFTFNAGNLSLDPSTSTARAGSLFTTFALQTRNVIQAPGDKRPADYGFLTTSVPSISLQQLSGPWYAIAYKVTMGTPGGLVSDAGFDSTLMTAWSPQSAANAPKPSAFIGLQLPGAAPGAKLLSIQGILKVTVGSITLLHDPIEGHPEQNAFNLRLNDIGLTFLGIAKLPQGSTIDFFLFGDPGGVGSLGWYAAYNQTPKSATLVALSGDRS